MRMYLHIKIISLTNCILHQDAAFVDFESYENYIPTFQLFLQTVVEQVDLLMKENDGAESVWDRLV